MYHHVHPKLKFIKKKKKKTKKQKKDDNPKPITQTTEIIILT